MSNGRIGTAVLELRTDNVPFNQGLADAEGRAERFGERAQKAGATLESMGKETRVTVRALGDFAQILSGTSALLSIATRGNEEWRDRLEKATVALVLTSTALNVYRNAAQLAAGATVAFNMVMTALGGPVGIAILAGLAVFSFANALRIYVTEQQKASEAAGGFASRADDATKSTGELKDELRQAREEADAAEQSFRKLSDTFQRFRTFAEEVVPAIRGIAIESKGLLGEQPLFFDPEQFKKEKAAAKDAAKELERLQEVENATNDLLLFDAAMRQSEEAMRGLDDETRRLIFDARDYARVAREDAAAQEEFEQWIRDTIPPLIEAGEALGGFSSEGRRVRAWLGQFVQENADAAAFVANSWKTSIASIKSSVTDFTISDALEGFADPSAAVVFLQNWRDTLEVTGELTDELAEKINRAMQILFGRMETVKSKTFDLGAAMKNVFADAFTEGMRNLENFGDALNSLINSLLNALTRHVGEAAFQFLFPTKKAHGGPFSAFQPLIVGEAGPELALFPRSGTIMPHHELASAMGGGGPMIIHVDARGAAPGVGVEVRRAIAEMGEHAVRASVAAVQDEFSRGGSFRSRMRR